jgi:hypothetical protein
MAARSGAAHRPRLVHVEAFSDDVPRRELRPSLRVKYRLAATVVARELGHPQRVDDDR